MNSTEFLSPIFISLKISFVSSIISFLIALVIARWMSNRKFYGKLMLDVIFMMPLVLPPTVIGFMLLYLFGKQGILGILLDSLFNTTVVFSWVGGVIAAVVVSFPLIYQTIKAGLDTLDRDLEDVARSQGASEWQVFRYITLPLLKRMLVVAYVLGFARAMGEFGATLMLAGNIPGRTQTIASAIYVAVDRGDTILALGWVGMMIVFSFLLLFIVRRPSS